MCCVLKATRGHCWPWNALSRKCPVYPRATRPYQACTDSQCSSVDSCLRVQVKLRRKVDDRVQWKSCGSYYGPVWSSVMVNWMKATSLELMGMDVCVECVRTPGQSRHLTAVEELRCIKRTLKKKVITSLCSGAFWDNLVWWNPGKLRMGSQRGS